jgi:hypothetical protein
MSHGSQCGIIIGQATNRKVLLLELASNLGAKRILCQFVNIGNGDERIS